MEKERQQQIQELCKAMEKTVGRRMRVRGDYDFLSGQIFAKTHEHISPTTLKRLWGYLSSDAKPRQSTLDLLAEFLGHDGWDAYVASLSAQTEKAETAGPHDSPEDSENSDGYEDSGDSDNSETSEGSEAPEDSEDSEAPEDSDSFGAPEDLESPDGSSAPVASASPAPWKRYLWVAVAAAVAAVAAVLLLGRSGGGTTVPSQEDDGSPLVIRLGQTFATEQDYLKLFGIHAEDTLWGQRLPHHPYLSLWGPQYHHPNWHNDGDSARLLPTITERWESLNGEADSALVTMRNNDRFISYRDLNELRLTFMRGLAGGDSLMFIGVYRMDLKHSDYHHLTWQRVADQVDLSHLDYLEELRN